MLVLFVIHLDENQMRWTLSRELSVILCRHDWQSQTVTDNSTAHAAARHTVIHFTVHNSVYCCRLYRINDVSMTSLWRQNQNCLYNQAQMTDIDKLLCLVRDALQTLQHTTQIHAQSTTVDVCHRLVHNASTRRGIITGPPSFLFYSFRTNRWKLIKFSRNVW